MSVAICRVIGNELPPRDCAGGKLATLQWILEREADCLRTRRYWVVNHLHDSEYRCRVLRLLSQFGETYDELIFDPAQFLKLKNDRERCRYAININAARNHAIRWASASHQFVGCLDQDCFFWPEQWKEILDFIESDQRNCPDRRYYGLTMKRTTGDLSAVAHATAEHLPNEEPQLIFRNDAQQLFDPMIPFGDGDKMRLLAAVGYSPFPAFQLRGKRCRCAGTVLHLSAGETDAELDLHVRMQRRAASIQRLLNELENRYRRSAEHVR